MKKIGLKNIIELVQFAKKMICLKFKTNIRKSKLANPKLITVSRIKKL